jgi:hypothetical protein
MKQFSYNRESFSKIYVGGCLCPLKCTIAGGTAAIGVSEVVM